MAETDDRTLPIRARKCRSDALFPDEKPMFAGGIAIRFRALRGKP